MVKRAELSEPEAFTFTFADQLAKPVEMAKPGDYCYGTTTVETIY